MCVKCNGSKVKRVRVGDGGWDYVPCDCVGCHKCEDRMKVVMVSPDGVQRAVPCSCVEEGRLERYMAAAKIPANYTNVELEHYDVHEHVATLSQRRAKYTAERFLKREDELFTKGIVFSGRCGTGKTHLAVSILKDCIRKERRPGLFCDARQLMDDIIRSFDRDDENEYQLINPVMKMPILLLDDLGAGKITEYTQEKLASILTSRYNDGLTTIITTNYAVVPPRTEAARKDKYGNTSLNGERKTLGDCIGERAFSRLLEMCFVVKIEGYDFREKVKAANEILL
jgi:DNA replication protein DnaC